MKVSWSGEGRLSGDYPSRLTAGTQVAGYRVEKLVRGGGMAEVYQARDERLGRMVALKVLAPALAADRDFRQRFIAESHAAAAVDHPHIIPIYEAGEDGGELFIAMRLVTGGDLLQVLDSEGPLPPERAAQFLSPVASALDAAHQAGLIHRDVKPGNILLDAHPDRPDHVYLSDFGISKNTTPAPTAPTAVDTEPGAFLGTAAYASPEQGAGLAFDGRSDQYSLACVAWHLLTSTLPFQGADTPAMLHAHRYDPPPLLADHRPDLPAAAGHALTRALAKQPGQRYATCGEFTDTLRQALGLPPYRPTTPSQARPRTRTSAPPGAAPVPVMPAVVTYRPTEDTVPPGPLIQPVPGPGNGPAKPARRRRLLAITLTGAVLAVAAAIFLMLATTGTPTATLAATLTDPGPGPYVVAVAFAPGGTTLAAGDARGSTYLWDTTTGKLTATLTDPGPGINNVESVAFALGGTTLAVGDFNGRTYLWDTTTRTLTATLTDPNPGPDGVLAVAFAPGGILAASDDNDHTDLWDTTTGTLTATLTDPGPVIYGVYAVAFALGGTTLAAGDSNGTTYLWRISRHSP
jgi:serine/threonine protein kinase